MSVEVFYDTIGGDLPGVRGRLLDDARIVKFVGIFMQDPTFETLKEALASDSYEEAFRAAHTIKGLASNLGFTALFDSSDALTEALRPGDDGQPASPQDAPALMEKVASDYQEIADAQVLLG